MLGFVTSYVFIGIQIWNVSSTISPCKNNNVEDFQTYRKILIKKLEFYLPLYLWKYTFLFPVLLLLHINTDKKSCMKGKLMEGHFEKQL